MGRGTAINYFLFLKIIKILLEILQKRFFYGDLIKISFKKKKTIFLELLGCVWYAGLSRINFVIRLGLIWSD